MLKYLSLWVLWAIFAQISSAQDSSKVEWIQVYFNMPADTSLAQGNNKANFGYDLVKTLTHLIDSAQFSVDVCVYDLEHPDLAYALANAKKRGLRVRVVTDNFNRTDGRELDEAFLKILSEAGIYSIDDDGDVYKPDGSIDHAKKLNAGADMHHKFAIMDYISSDKDDDIVWTGSTNMTYTGNYNTNTTLIIKDSGVAQTYTREFEVMWGGSGDLPNQSKAAFHKDKPLHSQPVHWVGNTKLEIYFSPLDRNKQKQILSERIVEVIKTEAQHHIAFSAFSITPGIAISDALWQVDERGILLDGVISSEFYSRYRKQGAIWASEAAQQGNRSIWPSKELRKLHHKTILIDAINPDSNDVAVTITGSYNFSKNADFNNDENLLIIYSDEIANQFLQDFGGIKHRAKGIWETPKPDIQTHTFYKARAGNDANSIEVQLVPGFYYPVYLAGIKAPWSYRGPDSTTYFARQSKEFLESLLKKNQVIMDTLEFDKRHSRYQAKVRIGELDLALALIQKGMAEHRFSELISSQDGIRYKQATQDAKEKGLGMWENAEKTWTVIPLPKKNDTEYLMNNPIAINDAEEDDLRQLPGIGPSKAKAILEYRDQNGPFESLNDLTKVKGIGPKTLARLRPFLTLKKSGDSENHD